jgi:hypothetical protein
VRNGRADSGNLLSLRKGDIVKVLKRSDDGW